MSNLRIFTAILTDPPFIRVDSQGFPRFSGFQIVDNNEDTIFVHIPLDWKKVFTLKSASSCWYLAQRDTCYLVCRVISNAAKTSLKSSSIICVKLSLRCSVFTLIIKGQIKFAYFLDIKHSTIKKLPQLSFYVKSVWWALQFSRNYKTLFPRPWDYFPFDRAIASEPVLIIRLTSIFLYWKIQVQLCGIKRYCMLTLILA